MVSSYIIGIARKEKVDMVVITVAFKEPKEWFMTTVKLRYIAQLLIPTHAHFHWLKFIKNI